MSKRANIVDIAKAAGVSISTVSRVLNKGSHPVSKELEEKVLAAAKEVDYIPNLIGRQLKTRENTDIAVIVPTLVNPFYPEVLRGIEYFIFDRKYNAMIYNTYGDVNKEKKYLDNLRQRQINGLLISSTFNKKDRSLIDSLRTLIDSGVKVVAYDQEIEGIDTSSVTFDIDKAGKIAVEHFYNMGHRNISIINSPLVKYSRIRMFESFKNALEMYSLKLPDEYVLEPLDENNRLIKRYEFENGKYQTKKLMELSNPPTAIFATNDLTAYGVLQTLAEMGIKVPECVSVMGYNNLFYSAMMSPPLTTIEQPLVEMGEEAVKTLIDSMENNKSIIKSVKLEPKLVVRHSTGPKI